jgi:lysophospholipase L1-like esterase
MSPVLKVILFSLRGVKAAWLLAGLTLLVVVACEGGARLFFYVKDSIKNPYTTWCQRITGADSYGDADWPSEYCDEQRELAMEWHPYVYWRLRPFDGEIINVDGDGLRHTWNWSPGSGDCDAGRTRIFVLGGSTIWGPAARDDYTVPSYLSKMLVDAGLCVEVLNLGETGYVSTQELILLQRKLQHGDIPDLVVFYDGVNEIFSAFQNNEAGLPQNEDHRRKEFNFLLDQDRVRRAYLSQLLAPEGLSRVRNALRKRLVSEESAGGIGLRPEQVEVVDEPSDRDELIARALTMYKSNVEMAQLMARHYGFDVLFYWQPMIFTKRSLTAYERSWYEDAAAKWKEFLLAEYQLVESDAFLSQHRRFRSLAKIFDAIEEGYYVDAFHLTEDGNRIVAGEIAKDVIGLLGGSARSDAPRRGGG